jgi:CRP-like cAMP-binding protein
LRGAFYDQLQIARTQHFDRESIVYRAGDCARDVYFVENGLIKILMVTPEGKECLLEIRASGDLFGEASLGEPGVPWLETATTMEYTAVKALPRSQFISCLRDHSLLEEFVGYLTARIARQQETIMHLVTVDSEHRLGETLLMLARDLGKPDARSRRIEAWISHEELSQMVGTTRPRITRFMNKFRSLGLIELAPKHFLIVKEAKLAAHLRDPA